MKIKILGPGCKNCQKLEDEVKSVLEELELQADLEKVEDMEKIMEHEIFMTPGVVIN